jgi:hypothetical protein
MMSRAASSTAEWVPPMALSAWRLGPRKSASRGCQGQNPHPASHRRPRPIARKPKKWLELQQIDEEIETHAFSRRLGGARLLYQCSRARAEGLRQQGPKRTAPAATPIGQSALTPHFPRRTMASASRDGTASAAMLRHRRKCIITNDRAGQSSYWFSWTKAVPDIL